MWFKKKSPQQEQEPDQKAVAIQPAPDRSRDELIEQYRQLHSEKADYGRTSEYQLGYIQQSVMWLGPIKTVLDYGCGRSHVVDWVAKLNDATAYRYDPAIPEYATLPITKADLVLNTDVLEHIPEDQLPEILGAISAISPHAFFNISIVEAVTHLPNGDNAHCTVRTGEWWRNKLAEYFPQVREVRSYRPTTVSFVTW